MKLNKNYTSDNIKVLEFPEHVRKRWGVYVGSAEGAAFHLIREVIDNSLDEATAGYNDFIGIEIDTHLNEVKITDNGRGIPIDNDDKFKSIFCSLHAGGKFNDDAYKVSSGLNGLGVSLVNALSTEMRVTVKRDGYSYQANFEKGIMTKPLTKGDKVPKKSTGTEIWFKVDNDVFNYDDSFEFNGNMVIDVEEVFEYVRNLSFLNKGLKIKLIINEQEDNFLSKKGIHDYMDFLVEDVKILYEPIHVNLKGSNFEGELIFTHRLNGKGDVIPFCNSIKNKEGGTHVTGFRDGLTRGVKKMIKDKKFIQKKDNIKIGDIESKDINNEVICIIRLLHGDPEYGGQTKQQLTNRNIRSVIRSAIEEKLDEVSNNAEVALRIAKATIANVRSRKTSTIVRNKIIKENNLSVLKLRSTKLSDCLGKDPNKNELFLVEGDSAGGSAKMGRDKYTQAIYALKGKPLNAYQNSLQKVLKTTELSDLISVLGCGVGKTFDISKLRYNKVIILSDADSDGSHIQTLCLTFFHTYLPELIKEGHIFIALPPLFKAGTIYLYSNEEKAKFLEKNPTLKSMQRFKGLGEMNPDQLRLTTLSPKRRKLLEIYYDENKELTEKVFYDLMSSNTGERKRMMMNINKDLEIAKD